MITIDGSMGEGGGQVLRTALSLSMITGESLGITNIRAGRRKPGLMRQHLTAVKAAEEISGARVDGDAVGSTELEFKPGKVRHGSYRFAVGTAGSATLVLQTILPALLGVAGDSHLTLEGGTHNPLAPPFDFLEQAFLPLLRRMGARVDARLQRHGFYPAGGGKFSVSLSGGTLKPLRLPERSGTVRLTACCLYAGLPSSVAEREARILQRLLPMAEGDISLRQVDCAGPGNAVLIQVRSGDDGDAFNEVCTAFGQRGVSAEAVAEAAAAEAEEYLDSGALLGKHIADQVLLPIALAGGGEFTTLAPTQHARTNMEVIERFLPVHFSVGEKPGGPVVIACEKK